MAARFSLTVALLLGLLASLRAAWDATSSETDGSSVGGLEHRRIVFTDNASSEDATLDLALFSAKSATVRVVDNPNGDYDLAAAMRQSRGSAGVNGGCFGPPNAPGGVLLPYGEVMGPLAHARLT